MSNGVKGLSSSSGNGRLTDKAGLGQLKIVKVENLLIFSFNLNFFEMTSSHVSVWLFHISVESSKRPPSTDSPPNAMSLNVLPIVMTDMPWFCLGVFKLPAMRDVLVDRSTISVISYDSCLNAYIGNEQSIPPVITNLPSMMTDAILWRRILSLQKELQTFVWILY